MDTRGVGYAPGLVMEIPLDAGRFAYGVSLGSVYVRYHDQAWPEPMDDLDAVLATPTLFVLAGATEAIRTKRWRKVGQVQLTDEERRLPPFCMRQDSPPYRCYIVEVGDWPTKRLATPEECEGLEEMAVYRPEHVERRLNEHFAKRSSRRPAS